MRRRRGINHWIAAAILSAALFPGAHRVPAAEPSADPAPPIVADPGYARFIYVQGSRAGTVSQILAATDGSDFAVLGAESSLGFVRTAWREAASGERAPGLPGRQWVVEATIIPEADVGPLAGAIVVRLEHPRQREVVIPVSGFVRPLFAVTPPVAALGDIVPGGARSARFFVRYFGEEPAALTGVSCDVDGIAGALEAVEPGRGWNLRVTLAERLPPGTFAGTLRIATSLPRSPSIGLPLSGRVLGPTAPLPGSRP